MQLKHLAIRRKESWEDRTRQLAGTVCFEGEDGLEVKVNVDEATSARIVELCAEGILNAGKDLARMLVEDVNKTRALEHKE